MSIIDCENCFGVAESCVEDAWKPSKLCMSCMIRGWMLDGEKSNADFVPLLAVPGLEYAAVAVCVCDCCWERGEVEDVSLVLEMRRVEPPPTLSSSARDMMHSE